MPDETAEPSEPGRDPGEVGNRRCADGLGGFQAVVWLSSGLEGRIGLSSVARTTHLAISYRLLKTTTKEPK